VTYSLNDLLNLLHGGKKKKKAAFSSEKDAYDFCRNLYKKNGSVTPELLRAYEFYQKNFDDECEPFDGPVSGPNLSTRFQAKRAAV
jgi:hypothetical protein